ncbi:MAG: proline racemase family protein [Bryobacterales bacterium]|jgi:4-hydroxyproline epimerase|nr:proline racemase family protein [Bryobacterales bacterium]
MQVEPVKVIDSHTGGEPTRVVIAGAPDLGEGPLAARVQRFRQHHDAFRRAVVNEPRGSDVLVGALLCEPHAADCVTGVIFFNNVGYLHMCGHGTIGLMVTLGHLGRIGLGRHRVDTPVGVVEATLEPDNFVALANVPSYRYAKEVALQVPNYGTVRGDIAWGGNWFFLVKQHQQQLSAARVSALTAFCQAIRDTLDREGIRGADGQPIDHVEIFGPPSSAAADGRNFVLCPGGAYDRSPCGTGTSAKLACLAADGVLEEGQVWRQESIVGSIFEGAYQREGDRILPRIRGQAFVNAEATLLFHPGDPFAMGIPLPTDGEAPA